MTRRALVAVLTAALLLPAASASAGSVLWSGYKIPAAKTADGGFVGARKTDGRVTYRVDAGAKAVATDYRRVHRRSIDRNQARAAWILSKYGALRIADQSAAVDVATYALLSDRPLGGKRAKARMRATGHADDIRALAKYLLAQSAKYAGPYNVVVKSVPTEVGGEAKVSVRITSYAGEPIAKLPVLLRVPGIAEIHKTSAKGRVHTTYYGEEVGLRTLRVKISLVPEWRLYLRKPKKPAASRIAIAGRKTVLRARDVVAVRASPSVIVPPAPDPKQVGKPLTTKFAVTGSEGVEPRTAAFGLYGPFPQGATPACAGTPVRTLTRTITGDGTYTSPSTTVPTAGVYVWRVHVGENQLNAPTDACGGAVRVRTHPTIKLDAIPGSKLWFKITHLPAGYDDIARLTLYGPYVSKANAKCGKTKEVGTTSRRVDANGEYTSKRIETPDPGYYTWRLRLPAGFLTIATTTACGARGSFVKVD